MSSPDWPVTLRIWNKVLPTMTKRKTPSKMGPILLSYCFFYITPHNYLLSQRLVDTLVVVALTFKSHLLVVRHFIFFYLLLFDDLRILRVSDNFLLFLISPFLIICFFMLSQSLFCIFYLIWVVFEMTYWSWFWSLVYSFLHHLNYWKFRWLFVCLIWINWYFWESLLSHHLALLNSKLVS